MIVIGNREDFIAWLNARLDKRVGFRGRTASCPLANWLRSLNPGRKIHVCADSKAWDVVDNDAIASKTLPEWACEVFDSVDRLFENGPVTGGDVLMLDW